MTTRIFYQAFSAEFKRAMREIERPIAEAATAAMREVGQRVKERARADIASAGFSRKWQDALRVDVFPSRGRSSMSPAALIYHNITYAGVFERGETIRGKPLMWIPLKNAPTKIRRKRFSAAGVVREGGQLHSINRPGKPPLLAVKMRTTAAKAAGKITLSAIRRGASAKRGEVRSVPLFVGVKKVKEPDAFSIAEIVERGAGELGAAYLNNVKGDD